MPFFKNLKNTLRSVFASELMGCLYRLLDPWFKLPKLKKTFQDGVVFSRKLCAALRTKVQTCLPSLLKAFFNGFSVMRVKLSQVIAQVKYWAVRNPMLAKLAKSYATLKSWPLVNQSLGFVKILSAYLAFCTAIAYVIAIWFLTMPVIYMHPISVVIEALAHVVFALPILFNNAVLTLPIEFGPKDLVWACFQSFLKVQPECALALCLLCWATCYALLKVTKLASSYRTSVHTADRIMAYATLGLLLAGALWYLVYTAMPIMSELYNHGWVGVLRIFLRILDPFKDRMGTRYVPPMAEEADGTNPSNGKRPYTKGGTGSTNSKISYPSPSEELRRQRTWLGWLFGYPDPQGHMNSRQGMSHMRQTVSDAQAQVTHKQNQILTKADGLMSTDPVAARGLYEKGRALGETLVVLNDIGAKHDHTISVTSHEKPAATTFSGAAVDSFQNATNKVAENSVPRMTAAANAAMTAAGITLSTGTGENTLPPLHMPKKPDLGHDLVNSPSNPRNVNNPF